MASGLLCERTFPTPDTLLVLHSQVSQDPWLPSPQSMSTKDTRTLRVYISHFLNILPEGHYQTDCLLVNQVVKFPLSYQDLVVLGRAILASPGCSVMLWVLSLLPPAQVFSELQLSGGGARKDIPAILVTYPGRRSLRSLNEHLQRPP